MFEVTTSPPSRDVVDTRVRKRTTRARTRTKQLGVVTSFACMATLLGLSPKVGAQTTTTTVATATTPTTTPLATLALVMEPITGTTGISLTSPNAMRTTVIITNETKVSLTNQQMVVRFGVKPDQINSVIDSSGPVGLTDPNTGAWFHTVAAIAPGERLAYTVNWFKYCPGKWPMAVRVGERQVSSTVQWSQWPGTSPDARCTPDETTNPQLVSFYALPWPSSILPTAPTGVVVVPPAGSSTLASTIAPTPSSLPVTTSTILPVTTTTLRPTSGLAPSSTIQSLSGPTSSLATTTTKSVAVTTTRLGSPAPLTTRPPTSIVGVPSNRPTTTLFCKTIGGNEYCGPKSSTYKEGQEKAQELKPGQKPGSKPVVKAKTKAKPKPKGKKK